MRVYENRPSGLALPDLAAHARREPAAAAFAAGRGVLGLIGVAAVGLPLGVLWLVLGVVSLASMFLFARDAGTAAIERPALLLVGRPKWDGLRRTAWTIEGDEVERVAERVAAGLDAELGPSLTALDAGDEYRGVTRREAFDVGAVHPAVIAWGAGGRPRLAAAEDADGVWLRVDRGEAGAPGRVTVLANDGAAVEALKLVAWRS